jgi:hypothetical protein
MRSVNLIKVAIEAELLIHGRAPWPEGRIWRGGAYLRVGLSDIAGDRRLANDTDVNPADLCNTLCNGIQPPGRCGICNGRIAVQPRLGGD